MGYCVVCRDRWVSKKWCHCTGCHRTFSSISGFERHQRLEKGSCNVVCLDPVDLEMIMQDGIWKLKPSLDWHESTLHTR
jgi:hypothetical protein